MDDIRAFVDCGQDGAIVVTQGIEIIEIFRMPLEDSKTKEIDCVAIDEIFRNCDLIILEQQFNPNLKQQKGMFTNASNFGLLKGLAKRVADIEYILPIKWKSYFNLTNIGRSKMLPKVTKSDSVIKANKLLGFEFKHSLDGVGDALLIAYYWHRIRGDTPFHNLPKTFKDRERELIKQH